MPHRQPQGAGWFERVDHRGNSCLLNAMREGELQVSSASIELNMRSHHISSIAIAQAVGLLMRGLDPVARGDARVFCETATRRCVLARPLRDGIVPAIFCPEALPCADKCTVIALVLDKTPLGKHCTGWQGRWLEISKVDPRRSPAVYPIAKYAQEEYGDNGETNAAWCCWEVASFHIFMNST